MIGNVIYCRDIDVVDLSANSQYEIGLLKREDLICLAKRGDFVLNTLTEADLCFIARNEKEAIHHTCVSLKSFIRPGGHLNTYIDPSAAYIYEVYTSEAYRGHGVARTVFDYIYDHLHNLHIRKVFASVANDNISSKRLFQKAGFHVYGKQFHLKIGKHKMLVVISKGRCFDEPCIIRLPFVYVYSGILPELERIQNEIGPFLKAWRNSDFGVALFGGGAHSRLLLKQIPSLKNLIRYIYDNDPKKQGRYFEPLKLVIQNPEQIESINPDVVIISSENFQEEIALQLIKEYSMNAHLVRLYPVVAYIERKTALVN